jgi:DNA ligase-1
MLTMYRKHVNGLGTWRIGSDGPSVRIAHATSEGGQEVWHEERVTLNSSGRSMEEQVDLRIRSRISRQRDRGYTESREEALQGNTNQMGLPLPMLAQPIKKVKNINYVDAVLQLKLNGHRCLATNRDGKILLYSRQGKPINLPHVAKFLAPRLPEGTILDGELYHHGTALQTIGSWIKKQQPESLKLSYCCYDLISQETYRDRHSELVDILPAWDTALPVKVLPIIPYVSKEVEVRAFRMARLLNYEGLILRTNDRPYEDGVRSASLLKIKEFLDCEVTVTDVIRAEKSGTAICICLTDDGKEVKVVPPGNQAEKARVLSEREAFIGRRLTIDYAELTEDGIPAQPVAREWRDDL